MKTRYFDNAATTKVKKEVLDEMIPYFLSNYGNPSSIYTIGRQSKRAIDCARGQVASLIGANKNEIYFTSGGSESDNFAIKGIAHHLKAKGNHIITSKIEHPAVLNSCKRLEKEGFRITYLDVDNEGKINLEQLKKSITSQTILITIMFANNEIGTIQPINEIALIAKRYNIIFHTDAVQAVGNIKINVEKMGIDLLSLSGHKIYGPKGTGALYIRKGIELEKLIDGGHQEKDKRAGTENVAGIVGLGKACEIANYNIDSHINKLKQLRNYYINEVKRRIPEIKLNGATIDRLPGNSNISFKGIDGGALLLKLDSVGICASSGSACSSGQSNPSHVLTSIGLEEEMLKGALRVTFGDENTKEDVDFLVDNLEKIVEDLRNDCQ